MKFVVSSNELLHHITAVGRVITGKSTLPILNNFLFKVENGKIEITASDLETTLVGTMVPERTEGEGVIAVPYKILMDTLKEFSDQPLTFNIDVNSFNIEILSETGKFSIMGYDGSEFPEIPNIESNTNNIDLAPGVLLSGINSTIFATADDEIRPVMTGILIEQNNDGLTFVATDAHRLVRLNRTDVEVNGNASFILPQKPASLLKNLLPKESLNVQVQFSDQHASFSLSEYKIVCQLIEGKYPAYNSVIPKNSPNVVTIDRQEFHNALKRVSVFSSQASNLVRLEIEENLMIISAQDIDFSYSAVERIACQYSDHKIEIGFKSNLLIEILNNLSGNEVTLKLMDSNRPGILELVDSKNESEDVLMLLMPMKVKA